MIQFIAPISGTMLSEKAGNIKNGRLFISVVLSAPPCRSITVNGIRTADSAGCYTAEVPLDRYENKLTARDEATGETAEATIYWLKNSSMKYRLSLDDNIWFLQDIAKNNYDSLFDNSYLKMYRGLHEIYGTKIHLNLYYCCPQFGGFDLTQFPDKYRGEWENNSDWLRLSFHALKDLPDDPYTGASYEQAYEECEMVRREIKRFAGEALMRDYTTIHWSSGSREAVRAFRANGYKAIQSGYVGYVISYYLDDETYFAAIPKYGWYKDLSEDMIFTTYNVVLNSYSPENVVKELDKFAAENPLNGFCEILCHEQYFYPHYSHYLPDLRDRVEAGIKWCVEHGYEPSFRSELMQPW